MDNGFFNGFFWIVAMETYKPMIYIKNQNTYSKYRSAGILCKINEGQTDERLFLCLLRKTLKTHH